MNSEIDITRFGGGGQLVPAASNRQLVSPPRRLFTRYVLPVVLLAGFIGVTGYSFRGAFVPSVDVMVTMPVPASEQILAKAGVDLASLEVKSLPAAAPAPAPHDLGHAAVATEVESAVESPRRPGRGTALFQAPGWIEPSPYPIVIPALRGGTVKSLEVIEGQQVTSGAVVARLIDEDQRLAVKAHESALRLKEARYQAALRRWENPTDLKEAVGTARAKAGQLEAQTRRLRDQVELASLEARIGNTLTKGGYEPTLETTRKETQLCASRNELLETRAEVALNSATLEAASERMRLRIEDREALETAEAEMLEARVALESARLALERSVILAPTSGTIMRLNVSPGSMLSGEMENGMTVAQLYKPEMLQVRVDVPLAEAAKVRPGLPAEIRVEALPDVRFRGELVNIVPQFNLQKNVLPVKVRIFNPDPSLRPEMIARVEFFADQPITPAKPSQPRIVQTSMAAGLQTPIKSDAAAKPADPEQTNAASAALPGKDAVLMFPASAMKTVGNSKRVMVVGPDGKAQGKLVTALAEADGMALVSQGLRITDKIIVSPATVAPSRSINIKGVVENGSH